MLETRLHQLIRLLELHKSLWWDSCYLNLEPEWAKAHQQFSQWLLSLADQQVERFESDHHALVSAAATWLPELNANRVLWAFADGHYTLPKPINPRQFAHVPGRKLDQISHFVAALPVDNGNVLEWCSGKGHLGRMLALQHQANVTSLEYDNQLCLDGQALASRTDVPQRFVCQDALSANAKSSLTNQHRAVALHACGDLHVRLLQLGVDSQLAELAISPCCYHLTAHSVYQPLSAAAQPSLGLTKQHLRLAVAQTATAPARVKRLRAQELSYRYGLMALLADYQLDSSLPSFSKKVMSNGFEAFCRWAGTEFGVDFAADTDFDRYQQVGEQQWHRYRRLELARQLFRPALESYLVLDRACYLEEQGYQVTISRFCPESLTPRNILLFAKRA